jgi:Holliday junction resolvase RusA-like endonuclease
MRFTLYYRGTLKSNGNAKAKHALRLHFHEQLQVLWRRPTLRSRIQLAAPSSSTPGVIRLGVHTFLPLVDENSEATVSLGILFLRPGPPGQVISHAGDIDNRLKTLFDALSMPQLNQLPDPNVPAFPTIYCVVSDDKLISEVSVRTMELLEPKCPPGEVVVVIDVRTEVVSATRGNSHLQ